MNRSTVIVDMDCIIVDFFTPLLDEYYSRTGELVCVSAFKSWDMDKYVRDPKTLYAIFHEQGFFSKLQPLPGAIEALKAIKENHDVVIATSPSSDYSAAEKKAWCRDYLSFVDAKDVFIGSNKFRIKGDVLIDDAVHNAQAYRSHWPQALIMTLPYAYNVEHNGVYDIRCREDLSTEICWLSMASIINSRANKFL